VSINVLRNLGLSEGEIRIYGALLDLGSASLNRIHESVGIERRNIYDILNKLIGRGLVTYVKENRRRVFQAAHPNRLLGYIEEHRDEIEHIRKDVEREIPALIRRFAVHRPEIGGEIFRGSEGIKAVWEDMLHADAIYWVGSGRYVPKAFPHFFASWDRRRIERKIWMHNLIRAELRQKTRAKYALEKRRFLPREFSGNPAVICVYGIRVVNFLYGKDLFAFVIESKELAENYRQYHKYLWENVAKP